MVKNESVILKAFSCFDPLFSNILLFLKMPKRVKSKKYTHWKDMEAMVYKQILRY